MGLVSELVNYYPSCQLVHRAATKLLHPYLWPAPGWCPSCGSCSLFPLPQFFPWLSSVDHASAFPLGSSGLQLWWWSWHPCAARAQSSAISSWWWWSPYPLAGTVLRGHGWRWFLARKCIGFSWGSLWALVYTNYNFSAAGNVKRIVILKAAYRKCEKNCDFEGGLKP